MHKTLKTAAIALAFAFSAGSAFAADVAVTFDPGVVAYGYTDGYWTREKQWRTWENPEHIEVYRKAPEAKYYEYVHTRDADQGWRGDVIIKR